MGDLQRGHLRSSALLKKSQACHLGCTVTDLRVVVHLLLLLVLRFNPFVVRVFSEPLPDWIFVTVTKLTFMSHIFVPRCSVFIVDYGKRFVIFMLCMLMYEQL
jgi:hypothetical protein